MVFFQSPGNRTWVVDRPKHMLKRFATKSTVSSGNQEGISSCPIDLLTSSSLSRPKASSNLVVTGYSVSEGVLV